MDKSKLPKKWRFDDKTYKIIWKKPRNAEGLCDSPKNNADERCIYINPNGSNKEVALILLHEGLHASAFYLDEETVETVSTDLLELLDKCGLLRED